MRVYRYMSRVRIGMRTFKTVLAVVVSMLIVDRLGTTESRLIFAMLGATAAMQPTFTESLESCVSQVVGVVFGAIAGLFLRHLPMPMLVNTGLGIALCIVLYNVLRIRFSPSMPIFMVVLLCTAPDIQAIPYAAGRIWDSAIGLGVGILINMLVFPYDNSRRIRDTVKSLDSELILFLERMFDGDDELPDAQEMARRIDEMSAQLDIFASQKLIKDRSRQRRELETFRVCEGKARQLVAHMEVLSHIGRPGCLNGENRERLAQCGAAIAQELGSACAPETDVLTNYHVAQILALREELLSALAR